MGCSSSAPEIKQSNSKDSQASTVETRSSKLNDVIRGESQRFDQAISTTSMTFAEATEAFSQAQMTESQMLDHWCKMQPLDDWVPPEVDLTPMGPQRSNLIKLPIMRPLSAFPSRDVETKQICKEADDLGLEIGCRNSQLER